jgi:hypothetical protein
LVPNSRPLLPVPETAAESTWGSPLRRTVTLPAQFHHATNNRPTHRRELRFSERCCAKNTKLGVAGRFREKISGDREPTKMMRYIKQLVHQPCFAKASEGILLRAKAGESVAKREAGVAESLDESRRRFELFFPEFTSQP